LFASVRRLFEPIRKSLNGFSEDGTQNFLPVPIFDPNNNFRRSYPDQEGKQEGISHESFTIRGHDRGLGFVLQKIGVIFLLGKVVLEQFPEQIKQDSLSG